jgi:hypothetical protein
VAWVPVQERRSFSTDGPAMRTLRQSKPWLLASFLGAWLCAPCSAATIRGAVTDASAAVIAGAKVTIKHEGTGLTRAGSTNAAGVFSFTDLAVGGYQVEITFAGFKTAVVRGIALDVADVRPVDVVLQVGDVEEEVAVDASGLVVRKIGGEVASLVSGEELRELPLNGRNFLQLVLLMPGVSPADFLNLREKALFSFANLSVSGAAADGNLYTVDGANNNDVGSNLTTLVSPSVDAIEEFKVHRNSYGAEYGQSAGSQVDIVTRSGTNQFHGSLYYFGRNEALDATNYFVAQAGLPKDKLRYHDFGFTVGGPIVKDKLHFFVSEEWNRSLRGTLRSAFVPTAAERQGDFSGPPLERCTPQVPVDPLTGEPFPGHRIPAERMSPGGRLLLQLYPMPNTTPAPGTCNNWVDTLDTPTHWRQDSVRVDWSPDPRTRLLLRYTRDSWSNEPPSDTDRTWGSDPFPTVDSNWSQPSRSLVFQLSRDIGASAVNTFRFSWSGNRIDVSRGGTDPGLNDEINAAIPTIYPAPLKRGGLDHSHAVLWGSQSYGNLIDAAPWNNRLDLFAFRDDYSRVFGKHLLKAGVQYSFNQKDETVGDASLEAGQFGNQLGLTTGNLIASLLLQDMTFFYLEKSANLYVRQRWQNLEAYVADSWRVQPRLTLDLGLRLSHLPSPTEIDDRMTSFDPAAFDPALGKDPCNGLLEVPGRDPCGDAGFLGGSPGPSRSLVKEQALLVAPRLGVAWDIRGNGKTALRAGAGRFFLRDGLTASLPLSDNPPFTISRIGIRALDTAAEPCEGCLSSPAGFPTFGRDPNGRVPSNWQWNVTIQQQVWRNAILEVSYVGSRGLDMGFLADVNAVPSGDRNGNGVSDRLDYVRADGAAALRPFGVFEDVNINQARTSGRSIYHGLETQVRARFGHGSQLQASYTFSKTIAHTNLTVPVATMASDPERPDQDRGPSPYSRPHIFNASVILDLPTFAGGSAFARNVLGGWQVATIVAAASGSPLTINIYYPIPNIVGVSGTGKGTAFTQRPNRVVGQPCRAMGGRKEQWLNPSAFTLTNFELGSFGDAGTGICEGPGIFQVDLALYKTIRLGRRLRAELRFEAFNVFNHTQLLGVNPTMNPRDVTYDAPLESATRVVDYELPPGFGQANRARDPRQIQFGLKLVF